MHKNSLLVFYDLPIEDLRKRKPILKQRWDEIIASDEKNGLKADRLQKLSREEAQVNTGIIYHYYRSGNLNAFLSSSAGDCAKALYRDEVQHLRMIAALCNLLSSLDINRIGADSHLSYLYHQLRLEVDAHRNPNGANNCIFSYKFWDLYFRFASAYNSEEN